MSDDRDPTDLTGPARPGAATSLWRVTGKPIHGRGVEAVADADVVVVGAGIAGLTAAYLLAREGRRVAVLDDGDVGSGETGQTSAHLSPILRERYKDLESMHGRDGARTIAQAHAAAVDTIEEIARVEGIDCEFQRVDGYLVLGEGDKRDTLEKELAALGRVGLRAELVENLREGSFDFGPALRVLGQGRFHPLKYLAGLVSAIESKGGAVATGAHVVSVEPDEGEVVVELRSGQRITAADVVVATNSPVHTTVAYHTKIAPYRTYIVGLRVPKGTLPALLWDTEDPYHYVRTARGARDGEDVLIVGGEDHKTGQADDHDERYGRLEAWARERFPQAGEVAWRWSGQVMESVDAIGYDGPSGGAGHVWVITGDSGNGLTNGTLGARIVADGVLGRENPWAKTFDPARTPLRKATEWIKENVNVAAQYLDWLRGGDVKGLDEIAAGEGAVLTRGLTQLAVYRDAGGDLHACSAVCTHAGCIVAWNSAEKTWDCPCHGSRFDPHGKVVNGPAVKELAPADTPAKAAR